MLSGKAFVPGMGIDSSVGVAGRTKKLRLKTRTAIPELPPVMSAILASSFPDILFSRGSPIHSDKTPLEHPLEPPLPSCHFSAILFQSCRWRVAPGAREGAPPKWGRL